MEQLSQAPAPVSAWVVIAMGAIDIIITANDHYCIIIALLLHHFSLLLLGLQWAVMLIYL